MQELVVLEKTFGTAPNNSDYSFLTVILIKCFELVELHGAN